MVSVASCVTELQETEKAHRTAQEELEQMRETMEKMEEERAEMIAEVEAQIERALAHMAVDVDDSDYGGSRPSSRMSSRSAPSAPSHRRGSDARSRPLRSFSTESTLAESYSGGDMRDEFTLKPERATGTVLEEPEEEEERADEVEREKAQLEKERQKKQKRFSAAEMEQDGMKAVDEGISQKSDKIAQKVLQIQRKVRASIAFRLIDLLTRRLLAGVCAWL